MKQYELTYIISSKLSEPEAQTLSQELGDYITKEGGILSDTKTPSRIKLAEEIKEESEGYLVTSIFHLAPEKVEDISKKVKSESNILRSFVLAKREVSKKPTLLKTPKIRREEKVALKDIEEKLEQILEE